MGIAGTLIFAAAISIAAAAYRGATGEAYSPLNHYVSELGQLGVSGLAAVFNLGLVIGGSFLAIFFLALGLSFRSALAWLYVPIGICAEIGGAFVGLYPMNFPNEHTTAALTFFVLGWVAVGLASIDFIRRRDPRFPWWLAIIGALTVAAFIGYLWVYFWPPPGTTDTLRASVSITTTLEWAWSLRAY